jgi:ribulose-phosphate 3-epimerase
LLSKIKIAPSILSADFSKLGEEIRAIDRGGCDYIHIDVMDGHFVPNLTIGPPVIKSLRKHTKKKFDTHLMIDPATPYIKAFADAGSDIITVHVESGDDTFGAIKTIKENKKKVGLSINPDTSPEVLSQFIDEIDLILIMTVHPGFGGQKFISSQLKKIKRVREMIASRAIDLEVDGGINKDNCSQVIKAGANVLVAGSSIFNRGNYAANMKKLRSGL